MKDQRPLLLSVLVLSMSLPLFGWSAMPRLVPVAEYTHTRDVRCILVVDDTVWVATGGGIAVHDRQSGAFRFKLTSKDGLFGNSIQALEKTGGALVAAGEFGRSIIIPKNRKGDVRIEKPVLRSDGTFDPIFDFVREEEGLVQVGYRSGLARVDGTTTTAFEPTRNGMWRSAAGNREALAVGGLDGRVWVGFKDPATAPKHYHLMHPILDIAATKQGFVLAGGAALFELAYGRLREVFERRDGKEVKLTATAVAAADDGVIVGTASGGVFTYRTGHPPVRVGEVPGRVTALFATDRRIWLGVADKGLYWMDSKSKAVSDALAPDFEICANHITRLTRHHGALVAGSFDKGACVLRQKRWQTLEGLPSEFIHGVASDGQDLYIGTSNGLMRYGADFAPRPISETDPEALGWFSKSGITAVRETGPGRVLAAAPWGAVAIHADKGNLSTEFIYREWGIPEKLTQASAVGDALFFSSESEGVHRVFPKNKHVDVYLDPIHLPEAWVIDLAPVSRRAFWAATCQSGVAYVTDREARFFDREAGLADDRAIQVAPFGQGAFITTLGGLSFFTTSGETAALADRWYADPRGASLFVDGDTLFHGTESGLVVFEIQQK